MMNDKQYAGKACIVETKERMSLTDGTFVQCELKLVKKNCNNIEIMNVIFNSIISK
jgi:hypothetical protein